MYVDFRKYRVKKLWRQSGAPSGLGTPGLWPVWPVVKTSLI